MNGRMQYQKRNGRDKQKDSNNQSGAEKRTYATPKKKQNPLVLAALAGGAFLVLILIIVAASSSHGDSNSAEREPDVNFDEQDAKIKELYDRGAAYKDRADRLREDNQKAADEYYRRAYDEFDRALAIVKPLNERFPDTKYASQEQQIEAQLADIKSKQGFPVSR